VSGISSKLRSLRARPPLPLLACATETRSRLRLSNHASYATLAH
jgi:hypothetical protein